MQAFAALAFLVPVCNSAIYYKHLPDPKLIESRYIHTCLERHPGTIVRPRAFAVQSTPNRHNKYEARASQMISVL